MTDMQRTFEEWWTSMYPEAAPDAVSLLREGWYGRQPEIARLTAERAKIAEIIGNIESFDDETDEVVFQRVLSWSENFHAQKAELTRLKEPMDCGHPRACWVKVEEYIEMDIAENMRCSWCAELDTLRRQIAELEGK